MNDFINDFWPTLIVVISLGGILGCALLLWRTSKTKVTKSKDGTSGHVWDEDLKEMNNPLPLWWVRLFAITIVFGLVYLALYPGLGRYDGQYDKEIAEANKALEPIYTKFAAMSIEELSKDENAKGIGQRLFLNNCAQCHGSDARGTRGFPNLTDHDWLYGGSPEKIKETITNGRMGVMPPMAAAVGNEEDIKNVANYVLSLSNSQHDTKRAELGKTKFTTICAACHGADGKGNQLVGAPNLTDNIWLHGAGEANIIKRIHEGKTNQMPSWQAKFTPEQIHVLASYVWGMSNH
jgi:cytochrome c oxidase cbb3-type subunit 3